MVLFGGGGMRGFTQGGGACFYSGGHAWFYSGGAWFYLGGRVWFYSGGMRGCSRGGHAWLLRGGVRGFFDEIPPMSGRYASYWNAFLFSYSFGPHIVRYVKQISMDYLIPMTHVTSSIDT